VSTAVTVANTDWEILEDLRDALLAAELAGTLVFRSAAVVTSVEHFLATGLKRSPASAVVYEGTEEDTSIDETRNCTIYGRLIVAAKAPLSSPDEADAIQELARLLNLAKNAVEASPPSDITGIGDNDAYHEKLTWGRTSLDPRSRQPWVVGHLPFEACYALSAVTVH